MPLDLKKPWDQEGADQHEDDVLICARYDKPSDLVSSMGSHSIWDADVLESCDFDTSEVPTYTEGEMIAYMTERGLGGDIELTGERRICGWKVAEALCEAFTGSAPRGVGRGTIYRDSLEQLVMAGL